MRIRPGSDVNVLDMFAASPIAAMPSYLMATVIGPAYSNGSASSHSAQGTQASTRWILRWWAAFRRPRLPS